jgi:hypothetical protein
MLGEPEKSAAHFDRAGELIESTGIEEARGRIFSFQSDLAAQRQDMANAARLAREAIRIGERGEPYTIWHGQVALDVAQLAAGEPDDARDAFRAARAIAEEFKLPALLLKPTVTLSLLEGAVGDAEQALRDLGPRATLAARMEAAYELWVATRDPSHLALARAELDVLRRHAPANVSAAGFDAVPLYRAIDAAR